MIIPKTFKLGGLSLKVDTQLIPQLGLFNASLPTVATIALDPKNLEGFTWEVTPGQEIREEMLLAKNLQKNLYVYSSIPGTLLNIKDVVLPDGKQTQAAVIRLEGSFSRTGKVVKTRAWREVDSAKLWKTIVELGILLKPNTLEPAEEISLPPPPVKKLIINGVSSEPYITTGRTLLSHSSKEIRMGIGILQKIFNPEKTFLTLDHEDKELIQDWETLKDPGNIKHVEPVLLAAKYPQALKSLICETLFETTDLRHGSLWKDHGILILDLETFFHIYEAVCLGKPLTERFVSLAGQGLNSPKILKVRVGTPLATLVEDCGGLKETPSQVVSGGVFSGFSVKDYGFSVQATTDGVLFLAKDEVHGSSTQDCTRCGLCINYCPAGIQPVEIYRSLRAERWDLAKNEGVLSCLECGLCSFVCPSRIPLRDWFRASKLRESGVEN